MPDGLGMTKPRCSKRKTLTRTRRVGQTVSRHVEGAQRRHRTILRDVGGSRAGRNYKFFRQPRSAARLDDRRSPLLLLYIIIYNKEEDTKERQAIPATSTGLGSTPAQRVVERMY